jgi:hypothetical protein
LDEIRLRSLDMITSKLEHNVISEYDLVQHKQLFIKLFEWFNFPNVTNKDKILDLILKLAKVRVFVCLISFKLQPHIRQEVIAEKSVFVSKF